MWFTIRVLPKAFGFHNRSVCVDREGCVVAIRHRCPHHEHVLRPPSQLFDVIDGRCYLMSPIAHLPCRAPATSVARTPLASAPLRESLLISCVSRFVLAALGSCCNSRLCHFGCSSGHQHRAPLSCCIAAYVRLQHALHLQQTNTHKQPPHVRPHVHVHGSRSSHSPGSRSHNGMPCHTHTNTLFSVLVGVPRATFSSCRCPASLAVSFPSPFVLCGNSVPPTSPAVQPLLQLLRHPPGGCGRLCHHLHTRPEDTRQGRAAEWCGRLHQVLLLLLQV